jgi:hypothetical protein
MAPSRRWREGLCVGVRWLWGLRAGRAIGISTSSTVSLRLKAALWRFGSHLPLQLERLQITKGGIDGVVGEIAFVLSQQPITRLGVLAFFDGVAQVCFLQRIERDDDAVDLCQRLMQVSFCGSVGKLDFLRGEMDQLCAADLN